MTRQLTDLLSFQRIVHIPFDACMAALESWQLTGHGGELRLGKSVLRGPAERDPDLGTSFTLRPIHDFRHGGRLTRQKIGNNTAIRVDLFMDVKC